MVVDVVDDRLGCTEITLSSQGEPITGTTMRALPLGAVVRNMVRPLVFEGSEGKGAVTIEGPPEPVDVTQGPTDQALKAVAMAYSIAFALGDPPAKAVERDLNLATSTAGRWIKLARDRGFLEIPADRGRRA
ncbi:hypothetical protein ACSDR0_15275 [Streptosporangium sp. G11]|uniref:hypothetical protein n=1 Tax=Streptosporangium sp. G11 TaxID=3436926 RepID=UPI003EBE17F9